MNKAPLPYSTLEIGVHSASAGCHVYLTDPTGRKIGVVWGKADEKAFTAHHLVTAANAHDMLISALKQIGENPCSDPHGIALRALEQVSA